MTSSIQQRSIEKVKECRIFKERNPGFGPQIPLAMILSYVESLVPFNFAVPGAKIGLANTVTILALVYLSPADAFVISTVRVILTSILFGNAVMMAYSLAGAFISVLVMILFFRMKIFGIIGISIAGAVFHNIGQCIVAAILMHNKNVMAYLPFLLLYGVISGFVTGILSSEIMKRLKGQIFT